MKQTSLPHQFKMVSALAPAADAAGRNSGWVSLKHYRKAWVVAYITQGNAATIALTLRQAQDVAGTGAKALAIPIQIWANLNVATNDNLVRQTDGVSFTTDAGVFNKMVVFEIDASYLDVEGGFDCIQIQTGASNVANITSAMFLLGASRFQQAIPPSAVVD